MPGVSVVSRDWEEVVGDGHSLQEPLGTSSHQQHLHEPLRGWNAFSATFRVMFKEEGRKSIEFAKKRQIVLFPLLLTLVTAVTTIGLQFLVGDSTAQVSDLESKTFTWDELRFALHLPLLMFSLGMGTFAFMGHDAIVHRAGTKNYLLAAPALQPLPNSVAHFAYFVKDLCFYVMLILTPVVTGMALGILLESAANIKTPLEWSSLPWTWLAMIITLAQGLAIAFFASALWMRGRPYTIVGPALIVALGIAIGLGKFDIGSMLWGLGVQNSQNPFTALLALAGSVGLGWLSSTLIIDDFDVSVVERKELFLPIYNRLGFLGRGEIRLIVAKEFVDLFRSGSLKKMTVSYAIPLLVLLGMAWLVDFAEAPIPINLLSYAPFLGFFGFNFYSWLTILDSPEFMNGLPLRVPQLIRAKVVVYFLATSWISLIFIVLMAWRLDEWGALPTSIIVMFANSVYIVALTAFLMGLRPNKAIFDASIMIWFWIGTVVPLLLLFLLSFTQGDVSLYGNWWERASQDGLAATASMYDQSMVEQGYKGMIAISVGLILASALLWKLMDRRWGKAEFSN
ncbi:hypothetical protein N9M86_01270 [Euryarchaeota archaeon]|nr:hypothetical protein [Candidatus Poseidoniaceae archaeon]MDA8593767.1 hypothetical protein [Euryarchaeota archaeon]MDA8610668.1 hypothetical protein [Euryarchaeota archaeon]MDA8689703.1 hypothetical protein [Euryarchaeota archaeon]MDA8700666.1 hypothetical protein [Euryarchaeota archaeon]